MECTRDVKKTIHENRIGQSNLDILEKHHDQAFKFINEGLNLDEKGKSCDAITCYTKGLRSIEAGINIPGGDTACSELEKEKFYSLINKLLRTKEQVVYRMITLNKQVSTPSSTPFSERDASDTKPSNSSDNTASKGLDLPKVSSQEQGVALDGESSPLNNDRIWEDVRSLLSIEEGVRLFHVNEKGDVSTWSLPCKLDVFQMVKEQIDHLAPPAFLKCGDWVYPLDPGKSPALKSYHRTYMFPDIRVLAPELDLDQIPCVGIVLANFVPEAVVSRFERVLKCYSDFRNYASDSTANEKSKEKPQRPPPPSFMNKIEGEVAPIAAATRSKQEKNTASKGLDSIKNFENEYSDTELVIAVPAYDESTLKQEKHWSDKVTDGIQVGAQWVSWGLIKGASYTSTLVERGAEKLRENVQPSHEPVAVDNQVSQNIRHLNEATGAVAQVSGFMVQALGTMTVNLGKYLAPHLKHHGKKLLPDKYQIESPDQQKKADDVMKVAIAGFQGFGLLFLSLEQAGKDIYNSISNAAVKTVNHRYGEEVADVTSDALGAAGNAAKAYWNVNKLGTKAIAKRAIKDTGKMTLLSEEDAIADRSRQRQIQER